MIRFNCPRCNILYELPDAQAGTKIRCSNPACNQKLLVPAAPGASVARTMLGRPAEPAVVPAIPVAPAPHPQAATARPRPARTATRAADGGDRGRLFERIGVGAFAVVVAVILVGLFMVLFPLMHPAASPAPAPRPDGGTTVAGNGKPADDADHEMKVEEVVARCKPSVALVKHREGSGSGFLVDGGFVVTNSHVVAPDTIEAVVVTFPSSELKDERYKVRLAYEDRKRDLAVLQVLNVGKLAPLRLYSGKILDGQPLVTIGSPGVALAEGGLSVNAVAPGNLSKQDFRSEEDGLVYLQYTAPTNPGNSGGPVLNLRGEVIGVHDAAMPKLDGVKLAIPVSDLQAILAKAASRKAAAVEHASAAHDARIMAENLAKTASQYLKAARFCAKQARDAVEHNQSAGEAYAAARKGVTEAQKQDKTKLIDPVVARAMYLDDQWDEITDLLSGSLLDDDVRSKLRQLRELYLQTKGVYEAPGGTIDDVEQQLSTIINRFPKLAESIDAEFGSVF